jgi:hypothetical protein
VTVTFACLPHLAPRRGFARRQCTTIDPWDAKGRADSTPRGREGRCADNAQSVVAIPRPLNGRLDSDGLVNNVDLNVWRSSFEINALGGANGDGTPTEPTSLLGSDNMGCRGKARSTPSPSLDAVTGSNDRRRA